MHDEWRLSLRIDPPDPDVVDEVDRAIEAVVHPDGASNEVDGVLPVYAPSVLPHAALDVRPLSALAKVILREGTA